MMTASRPSNGEDRPGWGDTDSHARTVGRRRADASIDLARHALTSGTLPDHSGDRPQVLVTIPFDALTDRLTDPNLVGTVNGPLGPIPITPETARRLACDADLIPAVLGSDGTVLDIGRSQRSWTTAQRRAARLRDRL
jgi:hypothetical protein